MGESGRRYVEKQRTAAALTDRVERQYRRALEEPGQDCVSQTGPP